MAETTIPDYPRGITFEQVWAAIMEDRENIRKWQEESQKRREESAQEFRELRESLKEDRKVLKEDQENARKRREESAREFQELRETLKEADRIVKETAERQKETDLQMKITDRKIGELGNRFGELAEHLVAPSICEKFGALHFNFEHISQNHVIRTAEGQCIEEIDLLLENGDTVMAVEVKAKPGQKDVDDHIGRMEVLRQRADIRHDTRKFQGAIAGAIMSEAVRDYAHNTGFYVIEQTGDTVKITIPENFTPREW